MDESVARYAVLRDRLRRLGRDVVLFVTPCDAERVSIRDDLTGRTSIFHGSRYDSLTDALTTVERLASEYEAES